MAKVGPTQLASLLASFSLLISAWNVWIRILPALSVLSKGKTWFVAYETITVSHWRGLDQEYQLLVVEPKATSGRNSLLWLSI